MSIVILPMSIEIKKIQGNTSLGECYTINISYIVQPPGSDTEVRQIYRLFIVKKHIVDTFY